MMILALSIWVNLIFSILTSFITGLIDTAEKWGKAKSDVIANGRLNWIAEKRKLHESEFDIVGSPLRNTGPKRKYDEMEYDHMEYDYDLDDIMVRFLFNCKLDDQ